MRYLALHWPPILSHHVLLCGVACVCVRARARVCNMPLYFFAFAVYLHALYMCTQIWSCLYSLTTWICSLKLLYVNSCVVWQLYWSEIFLFCLLHVCMHFRTAHCSLEFGCGSCAIEMSTTVIINLVVDLTPWLCVVVGRRCWWCVCCSGRWSCRCGRKSRGQSIGRWKMRCNTCRTWMTRSAWRAKQGVCRLFVSLCRSVPSCPVFGWLGVRNKVLSCPVRLVCTCVCLFA